MFKKAILKGFVSWVAASTLKEKLVFLKQKELHFNPHIILVALWELHIKTTLKEHLTQNEHPVV